MIPKNYILYLSDATGFLMVKNPIVYVGNYSNKAKKVLFSGAVFLLRICGHWSIRASDKKINWPGWKITGPDFKI